MGQSQTENHRTTQNSFVQRKGTLIAGTPGSSQAPLPSEYIYSQDQIQIQVIKRKKDRKNRKKQLESVKSTRAGNAKISSSAMKLPAKKQDLRDYF